MYLIKIKLDLVIIPNTKTAISFLLGVSPFVDNLNTPFQYIIERHQMFRHLDHKQQIQAFF